MKAKVTYIGASPAVDFIGMYFIKGEEQLVSDPKRITVLKNNPHFDCKIVVPRKAKSAEPVEAVGD